MFSYSVMSTVTESCSFQRKSIIVIEPGPPPNDKDQPYKGARHLEVSITITYSIPAKDHAIKTEILQLIVGPIPGKKKALA